MFFRKVDILVIFILLAVCTECLAEEKRGELYGMVVVIDSGHGGVDPGTHGTFTDPDGEVTVQEAEYVYDVSCRLWHMVQKHGAIAVTTTWDMSQGCSPDSRPQDHVIPSDNDEVFILDGTRVVGGTKGLEKRTQVANRTLHKYPNHRIVFLSLHFDAAGSRQLSGTHFIIPQGERIELADYLLDEFAADNKTRKQNGVDHYPVTISGDKKHGVRRLFVLSKHNNLVRQKVLIELGNFSNPEDLWRIRDHRVRESYAELITRALFKLNRVPLVRAQKLYTAP